MGGDNQESRSRRITSKGGYNPILKKLSKLKAKTTKEFFLSDIGMILKEIGLVDESAVITFEERTVGQQIESHTETYIKACWEG